MEGQHAVHANLLTQKGESFRGCDPSLNSLSDLIVKLTFSPTMGVRRSPGVSRA